MEDKKTEISESQLIDLVLENLVAYGFETGCTLKLVELDKKALLSSKQKIMIIKIMKLLWNGKTFDYGKHLIKFKNIILKNLSNLYQKPLSIDEFEKNFSNTEKYGLLFKILRNSKLPNVEYILNFFEILLNESKVNDILNKIFYNSVSKKIMIKINIDELYTSIIESKCLSEEECDYNKLFKFIELKGVNEKDKIKDNKTKERNKKKKTKKIINMEEDEDKIKDIKSSESNSFNNNSITQQTEINNNNNIYKQDIINPINEENENSDSTTNNNIIINAPPQQSYLINYFQDIKKLYEQKGYKTEILTKLINGEINIDFNLFNKKPNILNWKIEQHYKNLQRIIDIFNKENKFEENIKQKSIGYICLKNNKKELEGIFGTIPNRLLLEEINDNIKFPKDDFSEENKPIVDNCFKARGL